MPMKSSLGALGAALSLNLFASPAFAHATLEVQEAPVNSTYKGVMRVPHGCEGMPTLKVRIRIPEGVIAVKPMPKPGWTLETVKGKYGKTYDYFGTPMSEGVQEIVWTGKLLDEHYDEFVFRARLTDSLPTGQMLYFPAVQECEAGKAERWIEIPDAGKSANDYKFPAPGLRLSPAKANH
jgi:periplasmic copper chaperone A